MKYSRCLFLRPTLANLKCAAVVKTVSELPYFANPGDEERLFKFGYRNSFSFQALKEKCDANFIAFPYTLLIWYRMYFL